MILLYFFHIDDNLSHSFFALSAYNENMGASHAQKFSGQVKRNYDLLSRFYDLLSGKAEQRIVHDSLEILLPVFNGSILDIGCGTGSTLLDLKKELPHDSFISGLDISLGMCQKALRKIGNNKEKGWSNICCGNALYIPYKPNSFDFILMSFTLELFPVDLYEMLMKECRRILKPHGKILLVCMAHDHQGKWIYRLYCWAHEKFSRVIDCKPVDAGLILLHNGFNVIETEKRDIYGLPVSITLAEFHA